MPSCLETDRIFHLPARPCVLLSPGACVPMKMDEQSRTPEASFLFLSGMPDKLTVRDQSAVQECETSLLQGRHMDCPRHDAGTALALLPDPRASSIPWVLLFRKP